MKDLPPSIDWRTLGAVTGVKDQGLCTTGYAFSPTGAIEAQLAIKTGILVALSEEQIMDCMNPPGMGCSSIGAMHAAFDYIAKYGRIATEATYPYVGAAHTCKANNSKLAAKITGYKFLSIDVETMFNTLAFK